MAGKTDKSRIDTRAIGLDVWLSFAKWLTGKEHLHYGLWNDLAPNAANLGAAQEAYTSLLLSQLPQQPSRILDVGGGAGETAARLISLGHRVEIVIPSPLLAERCRANAPAAVVHEARFEEAQPEGPFDVVLFSESFQYIPMERSLPAVADLLSLGGTLLIADCFRSEAYRGAGKKGVVGGGHRVTAFREAISQQPFEAVSEQDLTEQVAPSIDIEQDLYHVFGNAFLRIDEELSAKRPKTRWALSRVMRLLLSKRRRSRLMSRLTERERTSEAFCTYNRYLLARFRRI